MPRPLKTYVTTIGFYEMAVAAPSMKAALDAWGLERNAFHQGFANETDDAKIVAATMAIDRYPLAMDVPQLQRVADSMYEFGLTPGATAPYRIQNMIESEPGLIQ